MQIIDTELQTSHLPSVCATIGFFDGLHKGHRFLLQKLKQIAAKQGKKTLVITFREHPNCVLQHQPTKQLLTTFAEKTALLSDLDIDFCAVFDFSPALAQLSAADFIELIHNKFSVNTLLVGYDHRFGHNRLESFTDYQRAGETSGVGVLLAEPLVQGKNLEISSSKIRHLIQNGDLETANQLLGYRYFFSAQVERGLQIGRTIGFPTANLLPLCASKILPLQGVFAVDVMFENIVFRGMMNIGYNPTRSGDPQKTIETNIFDFSDDIYGKTLTVSFLKKIRDEQKFISLDHLAVQLVKDSNIAKNL